MLTYEQAVKELYFTLYGSNPTNYHALLYALIGKADSHHMVRLSLAYPTEVLVWKDWQKSRSERIFFKQFGLGLSKPMPSNSEVLNESAGGPVIGSDDRD